MLRVNFQKPKILFTQSQNFSLVFWDSDPLCFTKKMRKISSKFNLNFDDEKKAAFCCFLQFQNLYFD